MTLKYFKFFIICFTLFESIISLAAIEEFSPPLRFKDVEREVLKHIDPRSSIPVLERNLYILNLIMMYINPLQEKELLSPHSEQWREERKAEDDVYVRSGVFLDETFYVGEAYSKNRGEILKGIFVEGELYKGLKVIQKAGGAPRRAWTGIFLEGMHIGNVVNSPEGNEHDGVGIYFDGKVVLGLSFDGTVTSAPKLVYEERSAEGKVKQGLFINDKFIFGQMTTMGVQKLGFFHEDSLIFGLEKWQFGSEKDGLFYPGNNFIYGYFKNLLGFTDRGLFLGNELLDGTRTFPRGYMKVVTMAPQKNDFTVEKIRSADLDEGALVDIYFPTHRDLPTEFFIQMTDSTINMVESIHANTRDGLSTSGVPSLTVSPLVGVSDFATKSKTMLQTKDYSGFYTKASSWLRDIGKFIYVKRKQIEGEAAEGEANPWRLTLFQMGTSRGDEEEKDLVQGLAAEKQALLLDLEVGEGSGNRGGNMDFTASGVPVLYHGSGVSPVFSEFFDSFDRYKDKRVELDTSFLDVGHVDEILTTVPLIVDDEVQPCGATIIAGSPIRGLSLYREYLTKPFEAGGLFTTLDEFEAEKGMMKLKTDDWRAFEELQRSVDAKIKENVTKLTRKMFEANPGCEAFNVIYIPQLVTREESPPHKVIFKDANAVNMVVLGRKLIIPRPKLSPFEEEIRKILSLIHYTPVFTDTSYYSSGGGEIHCGSNELRLLPPELDAVREVVRELSEGDGS